jgi:TonB family protein
MAEVMPVRKLLFCLCVTSVPISTIAAPKDSPPLKPSSPWVVNYGDDSCRFARTFGTDKALVFAIFDRFGPGQSFKLTLAGKAFNNLPNKGRAELRFGPDEKTQGVEFFIGELGKDRPAMILKGALRFDAEYRDDWPSARRGRELRTNISPTPISPERIAAVNQLIIGKPLRKPVTLDLGSMRAAFAASDKCIDNLITTWGIDPSRHATLSREVTTISNPGTWMTDDDYPLSARFRGQQGVVEFRLSVDETGKPIACHIQQSTRPPEFDETVCRTIMKRARFAPALDKDGRALTSFYRNTVVFQMP